MEDLKEKVFNYLSEKTEFFDSAKPCEYLKEFIIQPYGVGFSKVLMNEGDQFISQLSMQTKADRFQLRGKNKYSGEGVYFLIDSDFNIVYIGQSQDVSKRVYQHKSINSEKRGKFIHVAVFYAEDYKGLSTTHVESVLIKHYKPTMNKTDKNRNPTPGGKVPSIQERLETLNEWKEKFSDSKEILSALKKAERKLKKQLKTA